MKEINHHVVVSQNHVRWTKQKENSIDICAVNIV